MTSDERSLVVYVVSDSAGETGEFVVRAAAAQFHPIHADIRRAPFIQDVSALERVVLRAKQTGGIILFTLVIPALRDELKKLSQAYEVECIDLLGSLVSSFERQTGKSSRQEPGLNHVLDADYFRKVDAVEFAVKYDDARDTTGVLKADIVLVGVSRTSKTPLSMYLAHKKYKVANVPLVPEIKPPSELFHVRKEKIVGLTIGVPYLNIIRKERLKALGLPDSAAYATTLRIEQELAYAEQIMKQLGCAVIDVSFRAVEETASLIMEQIRLQS
ncbi:pyruvate, water dikinase regulatory protein [Paenibacillus sp. MMS18-CY102]|uniref:pyruvate, water dikinase regulatory protein n=1 Tax=Paenibacillus sp. MMS18-CY102 TaxID=2682849 RepID=UPI001365B0E2|nr:pyruvate, water dikinase regulatory protein [Paenibacillus sp. MMS18-CY102]MWC27484.1 pyruvate, phosphate dikinase/phosphoenolpyruvate synthase regulator [Paenibacillus sp. MMS18-CY102]